MKKIILISLIIFLFATQAKSQEVNYYPSYHGYYCANGAKYQWEEDSSSVYIIVNNINSSVVFSKAQNAKFLTY